MVGHSLMLFHWIYLQIAILIRKFLGFINFNQDFYIDRKILKTHISRCSIVLKQFVHCQMLKFSNFFTVVVFFFVYLYAMYLLLVRHQSGSTKAQLKSMWAAVWTFRFDMAICKVMKDFRYVVILYGCICLTVYFRNNAYHFALFSCRINQL